MSTRPTVWCLFDRCHEFDPGSHNARYCVDCKCKRKQENAVRRSTDPLPSGPDFWALQETRKRELSERTQQKNEWLLANSKVVFFDLETFDLAADFGLVMVGCVKDRGGETRTYMAHGDDDEKQCVVAIRNDLEAADFVCTYYGTGFDIPYLNTRLLLNNERPISQIRHVDLYYKVRYGLKLNRNRLANVENAFLKGTPKRKTEILPGIWRNALQGRQDALDYIADHCVRDVAILEDAFEILRGFVNLSVSKWKRYGASY